MDTVALASDMMDTQLTELPTGLSRRSAQLATRETADAPAGSRRPWPCRNFLRADGDYTARQPVRHGSDTLGSVPRRQSSTGYLTATASSSPPRWP
jgi:hypothetical protein